MNDQTENERITSTEAFELLAHETRMAAMEVLWEATESLRFSEIADWAGIADTGNFNYHFGKLVGHFVRKDGEKYALTRSGRRVMTAVLAGDVTDRPAFESLLAEHACPYCRSSIRLHHDTDQLRVLCSSCSGTFQGERETSTSAPDPRGTPNPDGTITRFGFPPAGLRDRDPETILNVALRRLFSRMQDMNRGICPNCAGPVTKDVVLCPDHQSEGICSQCRCRFAGLMTTHCESCQTTIAGLLILAVLADRRVRSFFHDHGYEPLDPSWEFTRVFLDIDERIEAVDPPQYAVDWTLEGESLHVQVDSSAAITAVRRDSR